MMNARILVTGLILIAAPMALSAQRQLDVRTSTMFESYSFGAGLAFEKISEFTIPVTITYQLGTLGNVALSSGYASVDLTSSDPTSLPNQKLSGVLDTEARLTVNLLPGRLVGLVTAALPTGIKTVEFEELSVLGAISSDVIGFSTANLGTGGSFGAGFAGAVPFGRMAIGFGATYSKPLEYRPILGQSDDLAPGSDFRLRTGIEGPLARRTYLRVTAIYARRAKDQINSSDQNGVGNRIIGYASVNHSVGSKTLTAYVFDVFRGDPQIEQTAAGAAILPKGNLLGVGGQLAIPIGFGTNVVPQLEYRYSAAAPDTVTTSLQRLGNSFRFGVDFRRPATENLVLVLHADALTGSVRQSGNDVGITGFRAAVRVELTP